MEQSALERYEASEAPAVVIELKRLTKRYGAQAAVNGLDLTIRKGEIFGLLGPNGAGKTTTILMMLGLTEPTSGAARVMGLDPVRQPLRVKRRVGYMPDDIGFYEDRTAFDNLVYTARLNGIPLPDAQERAMELLERVGLEGTTGKKVGAFSRGMRQRLGIADVLIKRPDVIILDEPTLGIDPEGVRELLELIRQLSRKEGITVLLSSHHLHQVQQICDRVGLFVRGELIAIGDVQTLAAQLDDEGTMQVELEASGWQPMLLEALRSLAGVVEFREPQTAAELTPEQSAQAVLICTRDVTSEAAALVIGHGANLLSIKRKQYGLDDIYHRYFEGGGKLERNDDKF